MYQLWTIARIQKLPVVLRRKLIFYAPLRESLDFMGIDPVTYTRAGSTTVTRRDGLSHNVVANQPLFDFNGEIGRGLKVTAGTTLQFATANLLDNSGTLVWFEEDSPKSTPTDTNPFSATGLWSGNTDVHVKEIVKAKEVLSVSDINLIQTACGDVAQVIPAQTPPLYLPGTFVTETPVHAGGGVYTLSSDPNLASLLVFAHGGLALTRVASAPGNLEYTANGTGNRTITPGLAPIPANDIQAQYVVL